MIWSCDATTGERLSVSASGVVETLRASGQARAARLVAALPTDGDALDPHHVDRLLWRVHAELQRLSEELQMPRRVAHTIKPWIGKIRRDHPTGRVRVLDIGCGLGYVPRWLSSRNVFDGPVEYVGVDHNSTLIGYAQQLAKDEHLDCAFIAGDAFSLAAAIPEPETTIVISTGLLHHLTQPELRQFFEQHYEAGVWGFAHWDTEPGPLTSLGAWIFHQARMRERLSRHDGVLSARRAHTARTLLEAASAADGYTVECRDHPRRRPTLIDVLRPITGTRTLP